MRGEHRSHHDDECAVYPLLNLRGKNTRQLRKVTFEQHEARENSDE